MTETICNALCVIMCLVGIFSVLWQLLCYFLCRNNCRDIFTVVLNKDSSTLPDKVYSGLLLNKCQALGKREIYVVDNDVPEHIKILCETCAENMGKVYFVSMQEVLNIFQKND